MRCWIAGLRPRATASEGDGVNVLYVVLIVLVILLLLHLLGAF